jgi:hypothetical protein
MAAIENENDTSFLVSGNVILCSKTLSNEGIYELTFVTTEPSNRKVTFSYDDETARDTAYDTIKAAV